MNNALDEAAIQEAQRIAEFHFPKSTKHREALQREIYLCLASWITESFQMGVRVGRDEVAALALKHDESARADALDVEAELSRGPDQVEDGSTAVKCVTPELEVRGFGDARVLAEPRE